MKRLAIILCAIGLLLVVAPPAIELAGRAAWLPGGVQTGEIDVVIVHAASKDGVDSGQENTMKATDEKSLRGYLKSKGYRFLLVDESDDPQTVSEPFRTAFESRHAPYPQMVISRNGRVLYSGPLSSNESENIRIARRWGGQ